MISIAKATTRSNGDIAVRQFNEKRKRLFN